MNRHRASRAFACALLTVGALACGQAEPAAPAPEPGPAVEPTPAPPPALAEPAPAPPVVAEVEPTAEELPVGEDFAVEAEQQVTVANYRQELDKLEKEIKTPD